jgi:putative ABC transport system permease protein
MSGRHAAGGAAGREARPAGGRARAKPSDASPARELAGRPAARWRRSLTGSATAAVVAFGLLAFGCTMVAVAGPRAGAELRTNAFRQAVAQTPAGTKTILGVTDDATMSTGLAPGIRDTQLLLGQSLLLQKLSGTFPLARQSSFWVGLNTTFQPVTDKYHRLDGVAVRLGLAYRSALRTNMRVIAGALPSAAPAQGVVTTLPVAVTRATASRLGLAVGSEVPMPGSQLNLRVTGIVQPVNPASPFWTYDPLASTPQEVISPSVAPYWQGEVFIAGSAVLALQTRFLQSSMQVSYMFPLKLSQLTAGQAIVLGRRLTTALLPAGSISLNGRYSTDIALSSSFNAVINAFVAASDGVSSVLALLSVSLAAVGAAVILLAAWLLAERRREEFGVLRARGASRRQLAMIALAGSAIAAVPGVLAGAAAAAALTPGAQASLAWWLAAAILAVAVAGPVLITVMSHRRVSSSAIRPDAAVGRTSSVRRLVAEAGLSLAAIGGLIVLREQGLGQANGDLYASAAPVLVAIPLAIVLLRAYPLAVRGLLRLTGGRAGATTFLGLARAARVSAGAVLPAFAMVLALGLVAFSGMVRGAVVRGEVLSSWQQAGADAIITGPATLSAGEISAVAAQPGVSRVLPAAVVGGVVRGSLFTVMLTPAAQYAAFVAATPMPAVPAAFDRGRTAGGTVPALASPQLATALGKAPVLVSVDGQKVQIEVVGLASAMTAVGDLGDPTAGGYLVLPRTVEPGAATGTLLVLGPGLNGKELTAFAQRRLPFAAVVTRQPLLAALERSPLQHGTYQALALGGDAAAAAALLVLLLTLLMSAGPRQMTLARMSTMGLSAGQGRRLALIEALPQVLAVLVGGLCCGLALAPLVGPALSLAVFTGSGAGVAVLIQPSWLVLSGAGLLVLELVVLTGQTMLASRGTPRSLRIGG